MSEDYPMMKGRHAEEEFWSYRLRVLRPPLMPLNFTPWPELSPQQRFLSWPRPLTPVWHVCSSHYKPLPHLPLLPARVCSRSEITELMFEKATSCDHANSRADFSPQQQDARTGCVAGDSSPDAPLTPSALGLLQQNAALLSSSVRRPQPLSSQ